MTGISANIQQFALPFAGQWDTILRLAIAALLGGVIGLERERRGQYAGFRTHLLVCLGAALAMVVSLHFAEVYRSAGSGVRVDPARVAYGVMGGIGFLGAGAIVRYGASIRGLTTAATLWCTAALGLACGFGMFEVAVAATVLVIFALVALRGLDAVLPSRRRKTVAITTPTTDTAVVERFKKLLIARGAKVLNIEYVRDDRAAAATVTFQVSVSSRTSPTDLLDFGPDAPETVRVSVR